MGLMRKWPGDAERTSRDRLTEAERPTGPGCKCYLSTASGKCEKRKVPQYNNGDFGQILSDVFGAVAL